MPIAPISSTAHDVTKLDEVKEQRRLVLSTNVAWSCEAKVQETITSRTMTMTPRCTNWILLSYLCLLSQSPPFLQFSCENFIRTERFHRDYSVIKSRAIRESIIIYWQLRQRSSPKLLNFCPNWCGCSPETLSLFIDVKASNITKINVLDAASRPAHAQSVPVTISSPPLPPGGSWRVTSIWWQE
jgi:hypothetical protein